MFRHRSGEGWQGGHLMSFSFISCFRHCSSCCSKVSTIVFNLISQQIFETCWFVSTIVRKIVEPLEQLCEKSCMFHCRHFVKPFVEKHLGWFMKQKTCCWAHNLSYLNSVQNVEKSMCNPKQYVLLCSCNICKWFANFNTCPNNFKSFQQLPKQFRTILVTSVFETIFNHFKQVLF